MYEWARSAPQHPQLPPWRASPLLAQLSSLSAGCARPASCITQISPIARITRATPPHPGWETGPRACALLQTIDCDGGRASTFRGKECACYEPICLLCSPVSRSAITACPCLFSAGHRPGWDQHTNSPLRGTVRVSVHLLPCSALSPCLRFVLDLTVPHL